MVKQEDKMTGCILGKIRPEIQTARANACKENECAQCGFNVMEEARRKQLLRAGGLEVGPDGQRRLYLGRIPSQSPPPAVTALPAERGEPRNKED